MTTDSFSNSAEQCGNYNRLRVTAKAEWMKQRIVSSTGQTWVGVAEGRLVTPAAVQVGDVLGNYVFDGYDGTMFGTGVQVRPATEEAWTSTAHGCPCQKLHLTASHRV